MREAEVSIPKPFRAPMVFKTMLAATQGNFPCGYLV